MNLEFYDIKYNHTVTDGYKQRLIDFYWTNKYNDF